MQGTQVPSLVGELSSHMPQSSETHAPQLLSPSDITRACVPQWKDTAKIPRARTKTQRWRRNIFKSSNYALNDFFNLKIYT